MSVHGFSAVLRLTDLTSGGPFRSTRLRAQSLIPNARIANAAQVQQTLVVDAQRQHAPTTGGDDENKNVKRRETIFGPDVGEDDEPGWTKPDEGQKIDVNVVKGWVEKAKSEEVRFSLRRLQSSSVVGQCSDMTGHTRHHDASSACKSQTTHLASATA